MNIYQVEIPENELNYCRQIIDKDGDDEHHLREFTRYLMEVYLQRIVPYEFARKPYSHVLAQWMACGRCITKVWDYFKKRFANDEV